MAYAGHSPPGILSVQTGMNEDVPLAPAQTQNETQAEGRLFLMISEWTVSSLSDCATFALLQPRLALQQLLIQMSQIASAMAPSVALQSGVTGSCYQMHLLNPFILCAVGSKAGAIAGGVVGGVTAIVLALSACLFLSKRSSRRKQAQMLHGRGLSAQSILKISGDSRLTSKAEALAGWRLLTDRLDSWSAHGISS